MSNEKEMKVGFCRYCGGSVMVEMRPKSTQSDWDSEATKACNCKAAQDARWRQSVLEDFAENMKGLSISPKVRQYLRDGAELLADGVLEYVQIRTEMDETIKITKKSGGIFLRKTKTNTEELLSDGVYK